MVVYWQLSLNGQVSEPITTPDLQDFLDRGIITPEHRFWNSHEATWQPAEKILGKNLTDYLGFEDSDNVEHKQHENYHKSEKISEIEKLGHFPFDQRLKNSDTGNIFAKHWRGEYSLPVSYWVVGIAMSLVSVAIGKAIERGLAGVQLDHHLIGMNIIIITLLSGLAFIWYIVGLWRSAENAQRSKVTKFWPVITKVIIVFGTLGFINQFTRINLPLLTEGLNLARGIDNTPPAKFQLAENGEMITLSGGLPFGTAEKLTNILDAAPKVTVINFKNRGGRIGEGLAIYKIMRQRGLDSYSDGHCASACTLAFLGGKRRILNQNAKLGFHSASIGSLDKTDIPEINTEVLRLYREHNIPNWFIQNAIRSDAKSLWYPTIKELKEVKYIHLTTNYAVGKSNTPVINKKLAEIELLKMPLYQTIKKHYPATFNQIVDHFTKTIRSKGDINQLIIWTQKKIAGILSKKAANSPDTLTSLRIVYTVKTFEFFESKKPQICYKIWYGIMIGQDANLYSAELKKNEMDLQRQILESPDQPLRKGLNNQELNQVLTVIARSIKKNNPSIDTTILFDPQKSKDKNEELCKAAAAFYEASLTALKPEWSARLHRQLARLQLNEAK